MLACRETLWQAKLQQQILSSLGPYPCHAQSLADSVNIESQIFRTKTTFRINNDKP